MPSSTALIGELIQRLDALLAGGTRGETGLGLSSYIPTAITEFSSAGDKRVPLASLVGGLFGGSTNLIAGLARSLFGKDEVEPLALPLYEKPDALYQEYDVASRLRIGRNIASPPRQDPMPQEEPPSHRNTDASPAAVVVQVNAMDAQSFTARSDEIASAVRLALARNHSLRDEIWEE